MRRVIWTLSARADLASIRAYIGQFNPLAAQRIAQRILTATDKVIGAFPRAGHPPGRKYLEFPIVWPYLVRYRIEGDNIIILRVRHGARQTED